jgi:hypothetical protein
MKKIVVNVILSIFLLSITGCQNTNDFTIGEKSDIEIINSDVSLSIKDESITSTGLTFILENNSSNDITYDETYELEIKEDNSWYKINVQLDFNSPEYILKSGNFKEIEINWKSGYGKLSKGEYRFVKKIVDGTDKKIYLVDYFTIK